MLKKIFNKLMVIKKAETREKVKPKLTQLKCLSHSFLCVHIPKTAGTSFRKSAEEKYPTISDYGKTSDHTSEIVKEHYYRNDDLYSLKNAFNKEKQIFSGHFTSQKYLDFVDARQIFSFVRDPLDQVVSHYNHSIEHLGYEGDFNDFIVMAKHKNIQSRYLNALPISLYGFIGLTAQYEESLGLINNCYGLDVEFKQDNIGKVKSQTKDTLTLEQCKIIEQHNSEDVILFNKVKALFTQRIVYQKNNQAWVHGWGILNANNHLVGCVYYERSDEVVLLDFFINNELAIEFKANQFTCLYPKAKFPRSRYVGFHVNLNNFKDVTQVQVKVKETGQIIFDKTSEYIK
jgi:hypothetical protein